VSELGLLVAVIRVDPLDSVAYPALGYHDLSNYGLDLQVLDFYLMA
jgi:hypothetical protein